MKNPMRVIKAAAAALALGAAVSAQAQTTGNHTVSSSLAFGRVWCGQMYTFQDGYRESELWNNNDVGLYGDEYAFFPVTGAGEIKPVILGDVPAGYLDEPVVWSEQKMFETFTPKGIAASQWEDDDDEWEYENENGWWEWAKEVWPDNKAVDGRRWVVVHANRRHVWSGVWNIRIGLAGTSEISDPAIVRPADDELGDQNDGLLPGSFHGMTITGSGFSFIPFDETIWWDDSWKGNGDAFWTQQEMSFELGEEAVLAREMQTFDITVPSAGTLVIAAWDDEDDSLALDAVFSITGANIVSDTCKEVRVEEWKEYEEEVEGLAYDRIFYKTANAKLIRRVEVSAATTLKVERCGEFDDNCEFHRMHFFPKDKQSVAIDVSYMSHEDADGKNDYWGWVYSQGYVTGSGVYTSGETATLTAVPGEGEAFDHWEVRYSSAGWLELTEEQATSPTLSFTVTDAMCGSMEDEAQIFIRAVWRPKYKIAALPSIVGAGTVTGSGRYFEGTTVTLTATPAAGYTFAGWSDGVATPTRQVTVTAGDEKILYAYFDPPAWTAKKAKVLDGAVYDASGNVAGVIQLKVAKPNAKKHNAKVSGSVTLLDGKKRTLKAAAFTVPADKPISANLSVKGLGTLAVTIGDDGFRGTLGAYTVATAKVGGKWQTAAKVYADATSALPQGTVESLLPDGVPVRVKGGKWAFDKAAAIRYKKGALAGDNDPKKPNRSAMKLTYTPKTGLFKGSFKVYAILGGKLKKYTVKVFGVVVDGEGTGVGKLAKPATTWRVGVK